MPELRAQLQSALGSAYELRRELGGGGMSRVFLARESALGRDVVVKVLHPELASGVNNDRFKREIQLAAQLQHPHIVPLLAAGEIDGLPYFTMPFVPGRSLRERLTEQPRLPVNEAVDIVRDVARALAYAHGRGVIHRDIKPDNVLLAQGSATVTDFGVAKAVSAARDGRSTALTSVGMSIGTPTYMAPEQAAGDPSTDRRADIYAWGVMAFEMLAGRPPFQYDSPHKMLVAHIREVPPALDELRPDCPAALSVLVASCLEKDPDARPQQATDLLRTLSGVATHTSVNAREPLPAIGGITRRLLVRVLGVYAAAFLVIAGLAQLAVSAIGLPDWVFPGTLVLLALGLPLVLVTAFVHHGTREAWRRAALGGLAALGGFAALVVGFMLLRSFGIGPAGSLLAKGVIKDHDRVLVADFDAPASDSTLGAVVSEGVRAGLEQSRAVTVVQTSTISATLQRMRLPASTRLDLQTARNLAEREGAKAIVNGSIRSVGASGSYILTLRLLAATTGDELASYQVAAKDATELIPAIDKATRRLRGKLGESLKSVHDATRLEHVTTSSLAALRKYTEGVRASAEQNYPRAMAAFEEAIQLDGNFALAFRGAAIVYRNTNTRPEYADSLRRRAFELRDRLPDFERALVEATYYSDGPHTDRAKALAANERALEIDPRSVSALNGAGLLLSSRRQYARADSFYRKVVELDSSNAIALGNALLASVHRGEFDQARRTLNAMRARFPNTDQTAAAPVWIASGQRDVAGQAVACATLLKPADAPGAVEGLACLSSAVETQGKLREHASLFARYVGRVEPAQARSDAVLDSAFVDAWFLERPDDATRRLDTLLAEPPAGKIPDRLYYLMAEYYSYAHKPQAARSVIARLDAENAADTATRRLASSERHRALGEIAIAEGRHVVAIHEFQAADTAYDGAPAACATCVSPRLAHAYDLAGRTDDAIREFENYLNSTYARRGTVTDPQFLAGSYKRLAELYEAKGDREKAAGYYTRFVELWKNADPELQPKVQEARRRLARLGNAKG
ncbi:MAG TPA: protein kinase [Gemmatimonadaceae bacterium]|nr:protein kinase [Gemmatimonadaceae bacterium]